MNPMAANYLKQIDAALDDLKEALAEQQDRVASERKKREELLNRYWSRRKVITTLDQGRAEYELLKDENERFQKDHREFRNRLGTLQEMCKTLREGLLE